MDAYTKPPTESKSAELIKTIKTLVAKGDHARDKAEQFYTAAGQHLKTLKAEHTGTWAEWERLLKNKCSLSTGRASELMQIADGRKTLDKVRASKAESVRKVRASSSLRSEERREPAVVGDARAGTGEPVPDTVVATAIKDGRGALDEAWKSASIDQRRQFLGDVGLRDLIACFPDDEPWQCAGEYALVELHRYRKRAAKKAKPAAPASAPLPVTTAPTRYPYPDLPACLDRTRH